MIRLDKRFKNEYGTAIYGLAIIGLLACVIFASVVLEGAKSGMTDRNYRILQTALNLIFQASNAVVLLVFIFKSGSKPDLFLKTKISPVCYIAGLIFALVSIFCFVGIAEATQIGLDKAGYNLQELYKTGIPAQDAFLVIVTVVAAPIAEELIFRGALLTTLKRRFHPLLAALLCAVAFSFMHLNPEQTVYQFFLGFGAALLTLATGSVIPAIIMHAGSNFIAAMSMIGVGGFTHFFDFYSDAFMGSTTAFALTTIFFTILGVAIFIALSLLIKKRFASEQDAEIMIEPDQKDTQPALNARPRRGLFKNIKDTTMVYYVLTIVLTVILWMSVLVQGLT